MKLKSIPRRLGYILGAQWTRDLSWTLFTILLSRQDPFLLGQIMLALGYGYLVKTAADVGLNEFLLSSFARRDARPTVLLGEVLWLKCALLVIALGVIGLSALAPILDSPTLAPAFDNILPALFGGLAVVYVSKNWKIALAPLIFMVVLFLLVPSLAGSVGVLVPVGVLIALGAARIMYKKGWL